MWDERVNTAIDEVAREMTERSSAVSAQLGRRVLARIESGDTPRRHWHAAFVLSPIVVAAAIAIAVFVARDVRRPGTADPDRLRASDEILTRAEAERPARQTVEPVPTLGTVGPPTASTRVARLFPGRARVAESPAPQRAITTPALEPNIAESIDVPPLIVTTLTSDPVQIEPLDAIAPLTVGPLDITEVPRRFE